MSERICFDRWTPLKILGLATILICFIRAVDHGCAPDHVPKGVHDATR